jgi:glycosyltransferase involved in cell wall biosynthesis
VDIVIATDRRYFLDGNGAPCCTDGSRGYEFWSRYLDVFDSVTVVARLCREIKSTGFPVEGERVSLFPLVNYLGPGEYIKQRKQLVRQVDVICGRGEAFLLRVPGQVGTLVQSNLQRRSYPYSVEVIGDPYDAFAPGAYDNRFRSAIRWTYTRRLRRQCRLASGAAYVTSGSLQSRYPPGRQAFATNYSSVEMPEDAYVPTARTAESFGPPGRLICVGTMSQLYKGVHILIDAVALCVQMGVDLDLTIVGDGKHRSEMEARCRGNGIADKVRFLGHLPAGEQVRIEFDKSDLSVLPSFTEGLPRVLIEAMGRGLPCIGSDVGGIPELLGRDNVVPARQVKPLADKIMQLLADPVRMTSESRRNLEIAQRYHADTLCLRRREFYQHLRDHTQAWSLQKAA